MNKGMWVVAIYIPTHYTDIVNAFISLLHLFDNICVTMINEMVT